MASTHLRYALDRYFVKQPRFRRALTKAFFGEKDAAIKLVGLNLTVNVLRENGYFRAWRKSQGSTFLEHEVGIMSLLAFVSARCDSFVDAGANIGVFSALMARRKLIDPRFEITAFEPHPDTYTRLLKNVAEAGVETVNVALSDRDGELEFIDGAVSHVFTAIQHKNAYHIEEMVRPTPCRRLDSYEFRGRSILLKLDVEGHELEVLKGAGGLFTSNRIAAVYCDGHDHASVPPFLKSHGFILLDATTLQPTRGDVFALLAVREQDSAQHSRDRVQAS